MTTEEIGVSARIEQIDDRVQKWEEVGAYLALTTGNTVSSIIEMIGEITKVIDNEELTEIIVAKLAVMNLEQTRIPS